MATVTVAILMGSQTDLPKMEKAAEVLKAFGVAHEVKVLSAHRLPDKVAEFAKAAEGQGIRVLIAGAGMANHLAGALAANTTLPVIGVPLTGSALNGEDALYSTVQMPKGVPVATVAIGNAANAGLLAARIVASSDPVLLRKMVEYQAGMRDVVMDKAERLERDGWKAYLGKK